MSQTNDASTTITIHVQPRAKKTEFVGWHGDSLKIRVSAPPADGAANSELIRYLAMLLGLPRGAVRILAGTTSRRKRIRLDGVSRDTVIARLFSSAG